MKYFEDIMKKSLVWLPEHGIGRYPVSESDMPYDSSYFEKYVSMGQTEIGVALNKARVEMVKKYWDGSVLDVGIGAGTFLIAHGNSLGFDVNPAGIEWLKKTNKWGDLYKRKWDALTMWDSLEHMYEPDKAIERAKKWVFISIPIFNSAEDILASKHFRKDEHVFYFTHSGLINWFASQGFKCIEWSRFESELGRDGITTYAFKRAW